MMIGRRRLIAAAGAFAAYPPLARAQQSAMPVIGWLGSTTEQGFADRVGIFRASLKDAGFVEGKNVAIEYRWADDHYDRLPALAADLVRERVNVIVTGGGTPPVLAAKAATSTIPIIFNIAADPVRYGILVDLHRPEGNVTGLAGFTDQLVTKRMELIADLLPKGAVIGALLNPSNASFRFRSKDMQEAAQSRGREFQIVVATSAGELEKAISSAVERGIGGLVVQNESLFIAHQDQIISMLAFRKMPAIWEAREAVVAGALASYGPNVAEQYQLLAKYAARILKGEKPADLPVVQPSKFELVINLKTARAIGITVPLSMLQLADEVIE
jgi:putative tryptophan/tyrosine transport system substrate-binding protein